ncbi:MAG: UvrB/UvrC motif-containing protein [Patescibacteria group bacterium]|nr:UvrB/UvrC motif-containing protein [Patescibacteria group bacterium]
MQTAPSHLTASERMTIEDFEKLNIPDAPGVYFWKEGRTILYIVKATSLCDRVRSYFSADLISTRGPRMVDMVFRADSIEWMETDSVLEAMIAEANLIKKHWPDYNVKEKDDRSWNYVIITRGGRHGRRSERGPSGEFPRVLTIRGRTLEVEKQKKLLKVRRTFGPFTSGSALREALNIIRRTFPFIDRHSSSKYTSTFYRQIGLAPDTATAEARAAYEKNIDHIILFFEGKKKKLIRELDREMDACAKKLEFEKAALIKGKIFALEHIQDVALIKDDVQAFDWRPETADREAEGFRIEAYDVAHMSGKETVGVMTVVIDGEPDKNEYRRFKLDSRTGNNDTANLREIIERRAKHPEWRSPNLIVIDGGQSQLNLAEKTFRALGISVPLVSVIKDDRHKPADILGDPALISRHKKAVLLANSEAHRFAISYHRKLRRIRNPRRGTF